MTGGIDIAAEWAGFETVCFVEIDKYCQKVLRKHWPNTPIIEDVKDVTKERITEIMANTRRQHDEGQLLKREYEKTSGERATTTLERPDSTSRNSGESIDIISGGFPCQPHSIAGKRKGSTDERNLWPEFRRVIGEIRPRWVLAENVPGLFSSDSGRFFGEVVTDLAQVGYSVGWATYGAVDVGALHRRNRVFIVAYAQQSVSRRGELVGDSRDSGWESSTTKPESLQSPVRQTHSGNTEQGSQTMGNPNNSGSGIRVRAVEPNVCRVFNGVSKGLYGGGLDDSQRMDTQSQGIDEGMLREVWHTITFELASQRQQSDEQLTKEFADALCNLPHEMALGEREATLEASRYMRGMQQAFTQLGIMLYSQESLSQTWQSLSEEDKGWCYMAITGGDFVAEWPGVPRVASGIKERVNRLKCLGNAVVPQQIYPILKAIADIENLTKGSQ